MLRFKLTDDKQYLQLIEYTLMGELKDLQFYFKKRQKGYLFNALYKRKLWDGYDHFVNTDKETGVTKIGVGLWKELFNFGKKYDDRDKTGSFEGVPNCNDTGNGFEVPPGI